MIESPNLYIRLLYMIMAHNYSSFKANGILLNTYHYFYYHYKTLNY